MEERVGLTRGDVMARGKGEEVARDRSGRRR